MLLPPNSPKFAEPLPEGSGVAGWATGVATGNGGLISVSFGVVVAGMLVVALGGWPIPRIKYAEAPTTNISNPAPKPISHFGIPLCPSAGMAGTSGFCVAAEGTTRVSEVGWAGPG